MAANIETLQTMDNFFKTQYLEKGLQRVLPAMAFICSNIPFVSSKEEAGKELTWPVHLSYVHGFTAHGANGETLALRKGTVAKNALAKVQPYAFTGRTQISNIAVSRATGGAQAFVDAIGYHVENLQESFALMVEQELLYGQSGLAICSSGAFADSTQGGVTFTDGVGAADTDGSFPVLIAKEHWAEHIWIGADGMPVDIYTAGGVLVVATEVVKVDTENRIIWLVDNPGADVQNYVIYRQGYKDNSGPGLQKILTHSTGNLFNINSTNHKLWRATQHAVNDTLAFESVAAGIAKAQGRGLDSKLMLHINNRVFAEMMPDFNTLKTDQTRYTSRMFTTSKDVEQLSHGMMGLKFIVGSTELTVASNPLVKAGFAFGIPDGYFRRTGSTDITYDLPGQDGKYFKSLEDTAACELRVFTDQALFSEALNPAICFTGITLDE